MGHVWFIFEERHAERSKLHVVVAKMVYSEDATASTCTFLCVVVNIITAHGPKYPTLRAFSLYLKKLI